MSTFKKFITHYSQFLGAGVISQMLGFVTFPILTRLLTKEQYGMMGLVTTTMLMAVAVAKSGLSDGIIRLYKEYDSTPEQRDLFSSTVIVRGLILALFTTILYIIIFPYLRRYLKIGEVYSICFMVMAAYLFIRPLNIIVLNILRIRGKTLFINVTGIFGRILSIGLSLSLLVYIAHDLYGYFLGIIAAELTVSLILFYWFFKNYRIGLKHVSGDLAVKLIKFGAPLLLTELSFLLLTYADRYMILVYRGEDTLGLYSVGYNLAMYISDLITFSLSYSIIPLYVGIYSREGKAKTEEFLTKTLHYLLIGLIPLCIGYYAISDDLFVTLASQKYSGAATFSPMILIGSLLLGLNAILNAGLYLKKKSIAIFCIMLAALIINIVLNRILIPRFGAQGAAIATLIACMSSTVLTVILSYRHIVITVEMKAVLYYLCLSALMMFIIRQIQTPIVWFNLAGKIVVGVLIIAAGVLLKEEEILNKVKFFINSGNRIFNRSK